MTKNRPPSNNTGVLFHNFKKQSERSPDMRGDVMVAGVPYRIVAWKKSSRSGTEYLSLAVSEVREESAAPPQEQTATPAATPADKGEFDDDIPF